MSTPRAKAHRLPMAASDRLLLGVSLLVPLVGLGLFFLYPLSIVVMRSLTQADGSLGLGNYGAILGAADVLKATLNSLWMSGLTTLICLVLGFALAYGLQRTRVVGKGYIRGVLTLPLLAPSLVQGLGLIFLLGRNGLIHKWTGLTIDIYGAPGLLLANTLYALPQAVMILEATLRQSDSRLYNAAQVMGASRWRQFLDITLPNARFGLLSAGFVVFTVTITDFGNAVVIGGSFKVLATEIYSQVVGQMNFSMGAVVGILLLLPTLTAVYIERVSNQRQFGGGSEGAIPVEPDQCRGRDLPLGLLSHGAALAVLGVVITVVVASFIQLWPYRMTFTTKHYFITIAGGYAPLWTTLWISLQAAAIGVIMLFLLAFALKRLPGLAAKLIYLLAIVPVGVPGLVLGLSYVMAFNLGDGNLLGMLYGGTALIALCNLYHYHSQGFLTMVTGMRAIPPALEETAACLGGNIPRLLRDIVLPYMVPAMVAVFFFLFMRSMVTLSAVIFLVTPQTSLASVSVMRLDEAGFVSQAAAFSTCIMLVVIAAMGVLRAITRIVGKARR